MLEEIKQYLTEEASRATNMRQLENIYQRVIYQGQRMREEAGIAYDPSVHTLPCMITPEQKMRIANCTTKRRMGIKVYEYALLKRRDVLVPIIFRT